MRGWRTALPCVFVLLAACAPVSKQPQSVDLPNLPFELAGHYSNFGQVAESTGVETDPEGVIDLRLSRLDDDGSSAWRVDHLDRSGGHVQHRLLRFQAAGEDRQLQISILSNQEISKDPQHTLSAAAARFDEDCIILMSRTDNGLAGHTDHLICRFDHPLLGNVGLFRQVGLSGRGISIDEFFLDADDEPVGEMINLEFDRHRQYRASVRLRLAEGDPEEAQWRESVETILSDDGKLAPLADEEGSALGFSLQLAWLPWQPNQPDYLRMAVINPKTGVVNAYKWLKPGTRETRFSSDWLEIELAVLPTNGAGQPPE